MSRLRELLDSLTATLLSGASAPAINDWKARRAGARTAQAIDVMRERAGGAVGK